MRKMESPRISLLPTGELALLLPGPSGERTRVALPMGEEAEALRRVLAMAQRAEGEKVGRESPATRFYLIHLERHGSIADEKCLWCQMERWGESPPHPVTKVPMKASGFGKGAEIAPDELDL